MSLRNTSFDHLALDLSEDVLTVTLDRPERLNAVNGPLHADLARLFRTLRSEESLGAIVLTGRGRAFCAGGDAKWFQGATGSDIDVMCEEGGPLIRDFLAVRQPVIAAVNGPATGLGATLALFCDVVIAADSAVFADPHVRMGVVAGDGGAAVWPWLVGMSRAKQYLMTGDPIDAVEAERIGLVNEVVPGDEVLKTAHALAQRLAEGPRTAIADTKHVINEILRHTTELVLDIGIALERETLRQPDHREAVAAFNEGRAPEFGT